MSSTSRPENLKDNLIALGFLRSDARWDEIVPLAMDLFASVFGSARSDRPPSRT